MTEPNANIINTKVKCNMLLQVILSYRLLFGFYYHLSSFKVLRFTGRLYCVIFTSVVLTFLYKKYISVESFITKSCYILIISEINFCMLFSLSTAEYSVIKFASNICSIFALNHFSNSATYC